MNKSSMPANASLKNPAFGRKNYLLQSLFCFILHPFYCYVKSVSLQFFPKSRNCGHQQEITSSASLHRLLAPPRWWDLYMGQVTSH